MVEYTFNLDSIFGSLSDPTRRDILSRLSQTELTVSEIARPYRLTLAAVSKHLVVLEKAQLIIKKRRGKERIVELSPAALADAEIYLKQYEHYWQDRFDQLDKVLRAQKFSTKGTNNGRSSN